MIQATFHEADYWCKGSIDGFTFEAQRFDIGSKYGIEGGRISRLVLRDKFGAVVLDYDRGWEVKPQSDKVSNAYLELLRVLNNNSRKKDLTK